MDNKTLGRIGEDTAVKFLRRNGYRILYRNWRCRLGEIDIIAQEKDFLVFIEIKTRRSLLFGPGYSSVNAVKRSKLITLAQAFLKKCGLDDKPCRIDIVSLDVDENNKPTDINLIKDAFWDNER